MQIIRNLLKKPIFSARTQLPNQPDPIVSGLFALLLDQKALMEWEDCFREGMGIYIISIMKADWKYSRFFSI